MAGAAREAGGWGGGVGGELTQLCSCDRHPGLLRGFHLRESGKGVRVRA